MREKLIALLKLSPNCICDLCGEKGRLDEVAEIIADNLIANGVTIPVRCKDCKRWKPGDSFSGDSLDDMQRIGRCPIMRFGRRENDFCCEGERRTDDERTG